MMVEGSKRVRHERANFPNAKNDDFDLIDELGFKVPKQLQYFLFYFTPEN